MNILHLLSQNQLTGAEVYATQLIDQQSRNGHNVFQVSNGFFAETKAKKQTLEVETKSFVHFIKNFLWLRHFLKKHHIQVIHTHSRAAAKLGYWARMGLRIGMISTLHGRQHPSFSKKLFNQYGDFLIAVCESIHYQLRFHFNYNPRRLLVLRNPISSTDFKYSPHTSRFTNLNTTEPFKIAVIGRTTGPKGKRSEQVLMVLSQLFEKLNKPVQFYLIGGKASDLNHTSSLQIIEKSVPALTSVDYAEYDLVVGSGRVALESLITGIPTVAFGEAQYMGLVRLSNLKENYATNFGDIDLNSISPLLPTDKLKQDLNTLFSDELKNEEIQQISLQIQKDFNSEMIYRRILRLYQSSYFLRNYSRWIPTLMYHKIPKAELKSQHKIFVTAENFCKHLQFFKFWGFKTVTFNELKKFKSGETDFKSFPKKPLVITFDDGYKDNLEIASPLLKEFDFKAQLFLLADATVNSNNWDHSETEPPHEIVSGIDRQHWLNSAFEIGSHGFQHQKISSMTETEARAELKNSKMALEKEFKRDIPVYAFTYGDTHPAAADWAFEEGYDYAVNTDSGGLLHEEDPYRIFRVNIFPNETWLSLFKKTSSWYRRYYFSKRQK